ncbi:[histone H3]-lysine(4) N-trimethyltransferase [Ranunculus cassubicifolius]
MRETFDSKLKQTKQGSTQTASGHAQATVRIIPKKHNFVAGSTSNNKEQTSRNMGDRDDTKAILARRKVKETLELFEDICEKLLRAKRANPKETGLRRVDCKAATILKKQNKCTNFGVPNVGVVPGVEVGDKFRFRAELAIIGLHRPYQSGIDYYKREWDGKVLALSIVASGGYDDYKDSSDVLIYSGQGGNPVRGAKEATDQKLERGNLGLRNSMQGKSPVRVIRGFDETKGNNSLPGSMAATLTYDGLYDVERFWEEKGPYGTKVFKFLLRRQPGQPELVAKKPQIQKRYKF